MLPINFPIVLLSALLPLLMGFIWYHPKVFGSTIEDIHNTHNGKLPGHHRAGVDDEYQPRSVP
jgi:hypothetical protein